jgi:hypothetical protein
LTDQLLLDWKPRLLELLVIELCPILFSAIPIVPLLEFPFPPDNEPLGRGGQSAKGSSSSRLDVDEVPAGTVCLSVSPNCEVTPEDARGGHSKSTEGHDLAVC